MFVAVLSCFLSVQQKESNPDSEGLSTGDLARHVGI